METGGELFSDEANTFLTLNGMAGFNNQSKVFTLTGNAAWQKGDVVSNKAIDLSDDFTIEAAIRFGAKEGGTGGISFVLHNDPMKGDVLGGNDGHLGSYGIHNGLGIEFDVSYDGLKFGDVGPDHTGFFDTDAAVNQRQIGDVARLGNLENGQWHSVQIHWDSATKTLSYSIDGVHAGTLQRDISDLYLGGDNKAYFGFTASTGAIGNVQQVRIISNDATFVENDVAQPASASTSHDGHGTTEPGGDCHCGPTHTTFDIEHIPDLVTMSGGARYNEHTNIIQLTTDALSQKGGAMS